MTNTIQMIEGWLNSNLQDIYSQREYKLTLNSILDSMAVEKNTMSRGLSTPEVENYTKIITKNFGPNEFMPAIDLSLSDREIEVSIDTGMIVGQVLEELKEVMK